MADLGTYSFMPWLRRGVANTITVAPANASRATVAVDLTLTGDKLGGGTIDAVVHRDVQLYGPGDVVGLDRRSIVRMDPRPGTNNFEPNYLAAVEFYDEDLPWRYTPAPPDGTKRLLPWLSLVVLADGEFEDRAAADAVLPFVFVADVATFPPIDALWAWAHVHVNGVLDPTRVVSDDVPRVLTGLDAVLGANRDLGVSRIVCPRELTPNTTYHAFVMPTFECGRIAGLGLDPATAPSATKIAWDIGGNQTHPGEYVYYHRWSFQTGSVGDFEYLVRLLQPRRVDPQVGQRDMDVLAPLPGLPPIAVTGLQGVLRLGGALKVPDVNLNPGELLAAQRYEDWDTPFPHPFQSALADLIELGSDYVSGAANDPDPVITPPLYGQWHAQTSRLLEVTTPPTMGNWVHELNLDPRFRVPAGFGTAVVQDNQEAYVAAAWDQLGDVLEANRRIRFGHLAREVAGSMHRRHLAARAVDDPGKVLAITAPVHSRIVQDSVTVAFGVSASLVATGPLSAAMRRITRPGSTIMRALSRKESPGRILAHVAVGKAVAARPKAAPPGVPTTRDALRRLAKHRDSAAFNLLLDERTPEAVGKLPKLPRFSVMTKLGRDIPHLEPGEEDSRDGGRFKNATRGNAELIRASAEAGFEQPRNPLDIDTLAVQTLQLLDPARTVPARVLAGLTIPARFHPLVVEEFREVMAYPEIDVPMYKPLVDKSSELFLPNLNLIPPNTISLLETNQRFIESYMVGLNHEMARELLWREYPTDQQGSYFRQFWDPAAQLSLPGETVEARRERLRDIPPLHHWTLASTLGSHDNREVLPGASEEEVVLVIRGELLKRYPTAVVYAQRAKWRTSNGQIDLDTERDLDDLLPSEEADPPRTKLRTPLYEARVTPDITFFGFDLTVADAKGGDPNEPNPDPGWFFVIRERPGEPRFGFDVDPATELNVWNDLAWSDVRSATTPAFAVAGPAASPHALIEPTGDAIEKHDQWLEDKDLHWGSDLNSSEIAYVLYQAPVLVAVHASEMLGRA